MKIDDIINKNKKGRISPVRISVLSFLILALFGSFLLSLPIATQSGESVPYTDALFTSFSATCITGLVLYDTAAAWSVFGQVVILLLSQIGALGIITITIFFTTLLGKKMSMRNKVIVQESLTTFDYTNVTKLIKSVIFITLFCESLGAVILSAAFSRYYEPLKAVYYGIFHSVSAFCNAGFDILGTPDNKFVSMSGFYNDPVILYTLMSLIIMGGLGFIVWANLIFYRREKHLSFHTKMVLTVTAVLIVSGTVSILAIEYSNPETLGNMSFIDKFNNALFQSVSARTAGMNTIPPDKMHELSRASLCLLMFVGTAPGSTGGGIKVNTLGIIFALVVSYIRGYESTVAFKNIVSKETIKKCICIIILALVIIGAGTVIITVADSVPLFDALFESAAAFSTTGLFIGLTPCLGIVSKFIIIFTMYVGRVGPATFAVSLLIRKNKKRDTVYPEAKTIVG